MPEKPDPVPPPGRDLSPPASYVYTGPLSSRGYRLNTFCLSLKKPANRERFLKDEGAYIAEWGLSEAERERIAARDWTGLLEAGGHLQAILKLAATLGLNLYHIGAHNVGVDYETMYAMCPRPVSGTPDGG